MPGARPITRDHAGNERPEGHLVAGEALLANGAARLVTTPALTRAGAVMVARD
jgi:hypothetical protein